MRKILYLIPLIFFACAEEEVDKMRLQSVYTEIEITNCQNTSFIITGTGGSETIVCTGNNFIHTTNLFQLSVIENTSFYYMLGIQPTSFNMMTSCIDITTKVYHNNSLHETRNYSIGFLNSGGVCANSTTIGEMYSIIAN
tara:strand:+ start:95 stop:514 length:420 start_codon:yes stop_codon:yes gene_type:complete